MVQDDEGQVLVFTYNYEAGESFDVVSQLETGTTVSILQTADRVASRTYFYRARSR